MWLHIDLELPHSVFFCDYQSIVDIFRDLVLFIKSAAQHEFNFMHPNRLLALDSTVYDASRDSCPIIQILIYTVRLARKSQSGVSKPTPKYL